MPTYEISVDQETRPDGDDIEVFPFGIIPNRQGSIQVEMEREQADFVANSYGVIVKTEGGKAVKPKKVEEVVPIEVTDESEGGDDK